MQLFSHNVAEHSQVLYRFFTPKALKRRWNTIRYTLGVLEALARVIFHWVKSNPVSVVC